MRLFVVAAISLAALLATSCANINSIGRRNTIPAQGEERFTAIHLDAQQRLAIFKPDGKFCAEASPDAMAAYAAALALGASIPGQGAGSASGGGQSNIASIGLRTQSITLMRDALYRLCEATSNGTVSPISATHLLARSQDLTAVVVAVEQLTGAVAANQAILTGSSNASSSASLVSNGELLDTARKNVVAKEGELADAQTARDTQQQAVSEQEGKFNKAKTDYNSANSTDDNYSDLKARYETEKQTLASEQSKLDVAKSKVEAAEKSLEDAKQVRDAIASQQSSALTSASAGTAGAGQFSAVQPRIQLDPQATEQVAKSVQAMVTKVLDKDYTVDACMTLMTNPKAVLDFKSDEQQKLFNFTLEQCRILLTTKIQQEAITLQAKANALRATILDATSDISPTPYAGDESTDRLFKAMREKEGFDGELARWVERNFSEGSVLDLLTKDFPNERAAAVRDLLDNAQ